MAEMFGYIDLLDDEHGNGFTQYSFASDDEKDIVEIYAYLSQYESDGFILYMGSPNVLIIDSRDNFPMEKYFLWDGDTCIFVKPC